MPARNCERDVIYGTGFAGLICNVCDELKPLTDFACNATHRSGHHYACKTCGNAKQRKLSPGQRLRRVYGLSLSDKRQMELDQRGVCGICKQSKPLVVDHDHAAGAVRGLLCSHCNTGLGMFIDDQELLRRAAIYLGLASERAA